MHFKVHLSGVVLVCDGCDVFCDTCEIPIQYKLGLKLVNSESGFAIAGHAHTIHMP